MNPNKFTNYYVWRKPNGQELFTKFRDLYSRIVQFDTKTSEYFYLQDNKDGTKYRITVSNPPSDIKVSN